jgi:membrane protease YdiL (CAAX protease family)
MRPLVAFVQRHALAIFLAVAFAVVWLGTPVASALEVGLLAGATPAAAALVLALATDGGAGAWALLRQLARWRVSGGWYAAAVGVPLAASLAVAGVSGLLGGAPPAPMQPSLRLFAVVFLLAAGEELGWRGWVLPRLLERLPALPAALLLGGLHALYHLPMWVAPNFPTPSYAMGSFLLASLAFGVVWTWLYQNTGGSVLITTLFHGTINAAGNLLFGSVPPAQLNWLVPVAFGVAALAIISLAGPALTRQPTTRDQHA